jgi:hypothetical protein
MIYNMSRNLFRTFCPSERPPWQHQKKILDFGDWGCFQLMHGNRSQKKIGNPTRIADSCVVATFGKRFMNNSYTVCNCKQIFELLLLLLTTNGSARPRSALAGPGPAWSRNGPSPYDGRAGPKKRRPVLRSASLVCTLN